MSNIAALRAVLTEEEITKMGSFIKEPSQANRRAILKDVYALDITQSDDVITNRIFQDSRGYKYKILCIVKDSNSWGMVVMPTVEQIDVPLRGVSKALDVNITDIPLGRTVESVLLSTSPYKEIIWELGEDKFNLISLAEKTRHKRQLFRAGDLCTPNLSLAVSLAYSWKLREVLRYPAAELEQENEDTKFKSFEVARRRIINCCKTIAKNDKNAYEHRKRRLLDRLNNLQLRARVAEADLSRLSGILKYKPTVFNEIAKRSVLEGYESLSVEVLKGAVMLTAVTTNVEVEGAVRNSRGVQESLNVPLGKYEISCAIRYVEESGDYSGVNGILSTLRIKNISGNAVGDVDHPHIYRRVPCLGDIDRSLTTSLTKYNIYEFLATIRSYLESYNDNSPYKQLTEAWGFLIPEKDKVCDQCNLFLRESLVGDRRSRHLLCKCLRCDCGRTMAKCPNICEVISDDLVINRVLNKYGRRLGDYGKKYFIDTYNPGTYTTECILTLFDTAFKLEMNHVVASRTTA
jgi:hypothetical protein